MVPQKQRTALDLQTENSNWPIGQIYGKVSQDTMNVRNMQRVNHIYYSEQMITNLLLLWELTNNHKQLQHN